MTDVTTGKERIGRFGWNAQQPTLLALSADANSADAAVRAHAGEAQGSRDAHVNLGNAGRQNLLAILNSL